jgi:hypothetical protein
MDQPKYNIGDTFYIPSTSSERRSHPCPDCLGAKKFTVTTPAGSEFTTDCARCVRNYSGKEMPSLVYAFYTPVVLSRTINGYSLNDWNKPGFTYKSSEGNTVHENDLIAEEATAMRIAQASADAANAKAEATPERLKMDHFANLPIDTASDDLFKNGLYDSWSSFRWLRGEIDDIIGEEGESLSAAEIREGLQEKLSDAMRYDFVFKGFTRAMETVVRVVNADDAELPEALSVLKARWQALPEAAQAAWEPTEKHQPRWSSEPCPAY